MFVEAGRLGHPLRRSVFHVSGELSVECFGRTLKSLGDGGFFVCVLGIDFRLGLLESLIGIIAPLNGSLNQGHCSGKCVLDKRNQASSRHGVDIGLGR